MAGLVSSFQDAMLYRRASWTIGTFCCFAANGGVGAFFFFFYYRGFSNGTASLSRYVLLSAGGIYYTWTLKIFF